MLYSAPIATVLPSLLNETDRPDASATASPSISEPCCVQVPFMFLYILTCPALVPLPSLLVAPITTVLPSLLNETDPPDASYAASPSISAPCCVQVPFIFLYILTCPALVPLPLLLVAPIATVLPSLLNETDRPDSSATASPSISAPCCVQVPFMFLYIRTCPASAPLPSLPVAPIATVLPSLLNETVSPDKSATASPSISEPI